MQRHFLISSITFSKWTQNFLEISLTAVPKPKNHHHPSKASDKFGWCLVPISAQNSWTKRIEAQHGTAQEVWIWVGFHVPPSFSLGHHCNEPQGAKSHRFWPLKCLSLWVGLFVLEDLWLSLNGAAAQERRQMVLMGWNYTQLSAKL